ncbi:MAG: MATE family efflux transporter [Lachnospiraceae bacterium]|nr:MATE family efflux transporter [Lachnospiraceae bacterium]
MKLKESSARDMTEGAILPQMILFSLPLLLGNAFQMLYSTVDTLVVGNFVGTQALAAVGSTTMIVNIVVFFFNGISVGASVVIGQSYGAKDYKKLHTAVETTIHMTLSASFLFTVLGILAVKPMLMFMATPEDVVPEASLYLRIYFAGIAGLLIYNMGSGILRAVGDSRRPLIFLIITSLINIALDLFFVIGLGMGIAGVAIATIISEFISAFMILYLLTTTDDIYRVVWRDLRLDVPTFSRIISIGLPNALQSMITAFSNVFVQSYINVFGSACMAGWSCYNKLDQFIYLPIQSMSVAATTFVSQNIGAKREDRARRGTTASVLLIMEITFFIALILVIFAEDASSAFTSDSDVIRYAALFMRTNNFFLILNAVNHVLAGALRGRGDSKAPMYCMIGCFVGIRQVYLFLATRLIANTPVIVGLGYPVGWCCCCAAEVVYYYVKYLRKKPVA